MTAPPRIPRLRLDALWRTLERLLAEGARPLAAPDHDERARVLLTRLIAAGGEPLVQPFPVSTPAGARAACNVGVRLHGRAPGPPLLVSAALDTPPAPPGGPPPPGANLPNSAVALLLSLAPLLADAPPETDVVLMLLDAESLAPADAPAPHPGVHRLLQDARPPPRAAVHLGAVATRNLHLHLDVRCLHHPGARALLHELFVLGRALGVPAFLDPGEAVVSAAHEALLEAGIPAAFVGDARYPFADGAGDTLQRCDPAVLHGVGTVLLRFLLGDRAA